MNEIWDRIEAWLAANAPEVGSGLSPPASSEDLDKTEKYLGVPLGEDFRACYLRHDGQSEESPWMLYGWEWLSLERIRDEWSVWKDLLDGGDFVGIQSAADGSTVRDDWWNPAWIPITYSGAGDHHCVDFAPGPNGSSGQVIEMWHDDDARPVLADSLQSWLKSYADSLEAGEMVMSDEYGALVPRDYL